MLYLDPWNLFQELMEVLFTSVVLYSFGTVNNILFNNLDLIRV